MANYIVTYFKLDGAVSHSEQIEAADDDTILDAIGESLHPYAINVHEADRLVGRFAPQYGDR